MTRLPAGWRTLTSPFLLFCLFVILLFALGGGGYDPSPAIAILQIVAGAIAIHALWHIDSVSIVPVRWMFAGIAICVGLTVLHLVPLPAVIWQLLPGRDVIAQIDATAGLGDRWRPVSMVPPGTLASLYVWLVPVATVLMAIRIRPDQHRRIIAMLVALGGLSALIGMLQIAGGQGSGWYFYSVTNRGLPVGLFANRNHQAVFLACLLPMLAYLATQAGHGRDPARSAGGSARTARMMLGAIAIVLIPFILICGSRAGIAAALVGAIGGAWIIAGSAHRSGDGTRIGRIRGAMLIAVPMAAIAAIAIMLGRDTAIARMSAGFDGEFRLAVWEQVAALTWRYFPVGSGIGSFREVYRMHEPHELLGTSYLNHAHNDWLEAAMTGGLPVMVLMMAAVAGYGIAVARLLASRAGQDELTQDQDQRQRARLGAVLIAILALASIVDYPLRIPALAAIFALSTVWLSMAGERSHKDASGNMDQEGIRADMVNGMGCKGE